MRKQWFFDVISGGFMLAKLLRAFKEWLSFSPRKSQSRSGNPDIHEINVEKIKSELKIEKEAQKLGEADLPRTGENVLTNVESHIVQVIEKSRHANMSWGSERLRVLIQKIEGVGIDSHFRLINEASSAFNHAADTVLSENQSKLEHFCSHTENVHRDYDFFRQDNGLSRAPNSPTAAKVFMLRSLLFLIVLVEGAANAFFFSKGMDQGLIGGFFYAGMFSAVNIIFAYQFGRYLIPNINHMSPNRRILGFGSIILAFMSAILIALLIAHFRDALGHNIENPAMFAMQSFKESPFGLQEIHSWLLFLLSFIFALFALSDAYKMDDPYPGYGRHYRDYLSAWNGYEQELSDIRAQLNDQKDDFLRRIDESVERISKDMVRLHDLIVSKKTSGDRLKTAIADAKNCLDLLVKLFRDTNQIYRNTPPPGYFSKNHSLQALHLPDFSVDADFQRYETLRKKESLIASKVELVKESIRSSFNSRYEKLGPLEAHFSSASKKEIAA